MSSLRLSWLTTTNLEVCSLCTLAEFNLTLGKKGFLLAACFCCQFEKNSSSILCQEYLLLERGREGEEGEEKEKESAHDHTDKITMLGFTN